MRYLLLLLAAGLSLHAQAPTIVTGPLTDAAGRAANCTLTITPKSVSGLAPALLMYQVIGGDLSGTAGGFGVRADRPLFHQPLQLMPGVYTALVTCASPLGSKTYKWTVPDSGVVTISDLIGGIVPPSQGSGGPFISLVTLGQTSSAITAAQGGCGANPTWRAIDSLLGIAQVGSKIDANGNLSFSFTPQFTGRIIIACGSMGNNNYSAAYSPGQTSRIVLASTSKLYSPAPVIQCYNAAGTGYEPDRLVDPGTFNVTLSGLDPSGGRCILGEH